jgi:hypothetical protein
MQQLIIVIFFLSFNYTGNCQTFLDAYKSYQLDRADTLSNQKARKNIKSFVKSQIAELDTIFQSYKAKTNFDFNTADTLFLIYEAPVESPFSNAIIIWSGKDTISYKQEFETIKPFKYKRVITYEPFIPKVDRPKGFRVVTERDSLITLVSKRDFNTINQLGNNQSFNDGSHVRIYVVYKDNRQYRFETCFPKQFMIRDIYKKNNNYFQ